MRRILFVDDEPLILDSLRSLLRPQRHQWDMTFVTSGELALAELEASPFDVIVTDMRMPKMDGATLLRLVQERHPGVVRIVLSGYSEMEVALRSVPFAHQFLSKPCEADTLQEILERTSNLQVLLADPAILRAVGEITSLPSPPETYFALSEALSHPRTTLKEVAAIIERDVAMCARVLQIVNSAFFGLAHRVSSALEGVQYLGINTLKTLVLSVEVFSACDERSPLKASCEQLQADALLTASLARRIAPHSKMAEDAFTAALLHDIGLLIMLRRLPERMEAAIAVARESGKPLHVAEKELFGVTHAEIGAYLVGLWGLPYPIVEAIAHHHEPGRVPRDPMDLLDVVFLAQFLAGECHPLTGDSQPIAACDLARLEALGIADRLDQWRSLARETAISLEAR